MRRPTVRFAVPKTGIFCAVREVAQKISGQGGALHSIPQAPKALLNWHCERPLKSCVGATDGCHIRLGHLLVASPKSI